MSLTGRTALITGAGGGIGRAISVALAKEKVNIILFGGNNVEKLKQTAKLVSECGVKAHIFAGDLKDQKFLQTEMEKVIKQVGGFDILINNAGVAMNCDFEKTSVQAFDDIMSINVRTPYILTQLALPVLKQSNRASIINIASVVSHAGYAQQSAYVASKHALLGFTKSLAVELYPNVRVHAVSPGGVYTDMVKISRPDLTADGMIMPEDIAEIVMFLLKNRSNAVIDEILVHRLNKQPFLV